MDAKRAKEITGGLSDTEKMPGYSYSLPASCCHRGAKLAKIPGTVCHVCYARKGRYCFSKVQEAMHWRLGSLKHPEWVEAMSFLINQKAKIREEYTWFRWHDSGDIQSMKHLDMIYDVCLATPTVKHWLPTREAEAVTYTVLRRGIPDNLTIRVTADHLDQYPFWIPGAAVITDPEAKKMLQDPLDKAIKDEFGVHLCKSYETEHKCGSCRACWDKNVSVVAYLKH